MITVEQFELIQRMAKVYQVSMYKDMTLETIIATMLRAHGLGLPVTEGPELFNNQFGDSLTMSANAQATLMKRAGYTWKVKDLTDQRAEIEVFDSTGASLGISVFTMQDAAKADITNKNANWKKYPRNMLMARALSNAAKWYAPDAFGGGALYTPEELGDTNDAGMTIDAPDDPTPPAAPVAVNVNPDTGEVTDAPAPENVTPFADEDYAPVGDKGNMDKSTRAELFVVGHQLADIQGTKFDEWRTAYAQKKLGSDLESFTQLNNRGAQHLIHCLQVDILHERGKAVYGDQWPAKEKELASHVSGGKYNNLTALPIEQLMRLKPGLMEKKSA